MASQRSPRYPSIPLSTAVEQTHKIFRKENTNPMSDDVAVMHMGYSSLNGASKRSLSSLRKYGLLTGAGSSLTVSDDARVIIADSGVEDQTHRREALLRCLQSNDVFAELYEKFKDSASELNIQSHLMKNGFKPDTASSAASSYIQSVEFALGDRSDENRDAGETFASIDNNASKDVVSEEEAMASRRANAEMLLGPIFERKKAAPTMKQDTYTLDNGELTLAWPTEMSMDEVEDLEMWVDMMKKKIRRAVERRIAADNSAKDSDN